MTTHLAHCSHLIAPCTFEGCDDGPEPHCCSCGAPINLVTYGSHGATYWRHNPVFRSRPA